MPLIPKVRQVGQQVVVINAFKLPDGRVIPEGTRLIIEGSAVGDDYKVSYKFKWGDRSGTPCIYWVKASDIKTSK